MVLRVLRRVGLQEMDSSAWKEESACKGVRGDDSRSKENFGEEKKPISYMEEWD